MPQRKLFLAAGNMGFDFELFIGVRGNNDAIFFIDLDGEAKIHEILRCD
jgi:hypothetical protein